MTSDPSKQRAYAVLAFVFLAGLALARLSAYGIWDPWELAIAETARKAAAGDVEGWVKLPVRLIGWAFSAAGAPREWVGRLPFALSGVLMLAATGLTAYRFARARVALYAMVVLGCSPIFLLHSRQMLGQSPTFLGATLVFLGTAAAIFPDRNGALVSLRASVGWLTLAVLGIVIGTASAGVLLAVVPPLGAVGLAALFVGPTHDGTPDAKRSMWLRHAVIAAACAAAALVARVVLRHEASVSYWTGGAPLDASVPSFERVLEHGFHGLGAFSCLVPLALARLLRDDDTEAVGARALGIASTLFVALAYAATTLHLSAFGGASFPAAAGLALAVALWLDEHADSGRPFWPELTVALLLLGLLVRDYALYPGSPWNSLEVEGLKAPEVFNPRAAWAAVLGLFGVGLALSCMAYPDERRADLKAPYVGLAKTWRTGWGHKAWLSFAALLALSLLAFGVIALAAPGVVRMTSLGIRIGKVMGFAPLCVPVLIALGQLVFAHSAKLAGARHGLVIVGALAVGVYTSQVFLPRVSEHFSSRDMFDTYNKLAQPNEPLAQHRVEGRAASYYARGNVREIAARNELLDFLAENGRRWAAFPSDQLADIDVAFRKRTGRHLFVPKSENARVALVASEPIAGEADENPLTRFVLRSVPAVQHTVGARFEDAVELVGYDLELPRGDHVGPGQSFVITWVWRALKANVGAYKIFVHIDSGSQRIHGDHEPVDGKYPVRLWDEGDVILDRQTVSVPATNPPGDYSLNVGLFRGESRLRVQAGEHDGQDRVRAGTVRVK